MEHLSFTKKFDLEVNGVFYSPPDAGVLMTGRVRSVQQGQVKAPDVVPERTGRDCK